MSDFLLFLRNNWFFIVELVLLVVSILITILKKKAIITIDEGFFSQLLADVPGLIQSAEKLYPSGNGDKKLSYVLKHVIEMVCEHYRCSVNEIPSSIIPQIVGFVEDILSTPTKKGGTVDVQGKIV